MLFKKGLDKGLRLHRFKRNHSLPRVQKVLGILKTIQPASLLDIGTGRAVFLWPLIDMFLSCGARVKIVYIESPYEILLKQNQIRKNSVPKEILARLLRKLDVPGIDEANAVL
ncbi:MAG: hypothetical protein R6U27_05975 [Desulfobacterales bacterium]